MERDVREDGWNTHGDEGLLTPSRAASGAVGDIVWWGGFDYRH